MNCGAAFPALADCAALCIGGAGVSSPKARQLLEASLAQRGFAGALMLCSDFEIALRGAMDGPGCILIAGTARWALAAMPPGKPRAWAAGDI
ncbi:MAG: hypothetical protein V8Q82_09890 [Christensenellales bacterium]